MLVTVVVNGIRLFFLPLAGAALPVSGDSGFRDCRMSAGDGCLTDDIGGETLRRRINLKTYSYLIAFEIPP